MREYTRYRKLGWKTGLPSSPSEASLLWNNTHTATLEDYGLSGNVKDLYQQEAIRASDIQIEMEYLESLKLLNKAGS